VLPVGLAAGASSSRIVNEITSARKLRSAECYCSQATLDDLLSDKIMAPVLRSAGYEPR
jgi:hypothetical protein